MKKMWLTTDTIEVSVTEETFERGVTIHDIKEQMAKYSDEEIYADVKSYGDCPEFSEFEDRDALLEYFLFVHDDEEWEEDE